MLTVILEIAPSLKCEQISDRSFPGLTIVICSLAIVVCTPGIASCEGHDHAGALGATVSGTVAVLWCLPADTFEFETLTPNSDRRRTLQEMG